MELNSHIFSYLNPVNSDNVTLNIYIFRIFNIFYIFRRWISESVGTDPVDIGALQYTEILSYKLPVAVRLFPFVWS